MKTERTIKLNGDHIVRNGSIVRGLDNKVCTILMDDLTVDVRDHTTNKISIGGVVRTGEFGVVLENIEQVIEY